MVTDVNDGRAAKYKTKPRELRASKPEVLDPMYLPSTTTKNDAVRKKRLVGNIIGKYKRQQKKSYKA